MACGLFICVYSKNIICIYVLALCCFAYATMIHAIPDHVYVQEGQKLELDKKNSGHTGNVHKTAIRYGTDRGSGRFRQ